MAAHALAGRAGRRRRPRRRPRAPRPGRRPGWPRRRPRRSRSRTACSTRPSPRDAGAPPTPAPSPPTPTCASSRSRSASAPSIRDAVARVEEGFVRVRSALREPGTAVSAGARGRGRPAASSSRRRRRSPRRERRRLGPVRPVGGHHPARGVRDRAHRRARCSRTCGAAVSWRSSGRSGPVRGSASLASLATAVLLSTVFRLHPTAREALEGAGHAARRGVLFWVSYWLISKAEAERWQRFIQGKVKQAVAAGSAGALAAASFLAVYREGFETVLFYQALLGGAPAGDVMVPRRLPRRARGARRRVGGHVAARAPRADPPVLPADRGASST